MFLGFRKSGNKNVLYIKNMECHLIIELNYKHENNMFEDQ